MLFMVKGVRDHIYQASLLASYCFAPSVRAPSPAKSLAQNHSTSHLPYCPSSIPRPLPFPTSPPRAPQTLFENVARQSVDGLLDEPPEMDAKRRADMELLSQLRSAKRALESLV